MLPASHRGSSSGGDSTSARTKQSVSSDACRAAGRRCGERQRSQRSAALSVRLCARVGARPRREIIKADAVAAHDFSVRCCCCLRGGGIASQLMDIFAVILDHVRIVGLRMRRSVAFLHSHFYGFSLFAFVNLENVFKQCIWSSYFVCGGASRVKAPKQICLLGGFF